MRILNYYHKTDIGKSRSTDEDFAYAYTNSFDETLLLMFDGAGGTYNGEYAAKLACISYAMHFKERKNRFRNIFEMKNFVKEVTKDTNQLLLDSNSGINASKKENMKTTVTGMLISKKRNLMFSIGDSRGYIVTNGLLKKITFDDSPQGYLERGYFNNDDMKGYENKETQLFALLGHEKNIKVNCYTIREKFSHVLLCTDGLYNRVTTKEMNEILNQRKDIALKVNDLINLANERGGQDNIGVLICEVENE